MGMLVQLPCLGSKFMRKPAFVKKMKGHLELDSFYELWKSAYLLN